MALRCAILLLLLATPAHADTILDMRAGNDWEGTVVLPGLLSASVDSRGGLFEPEMACNPCAPGTLIGVNAAWSGSDFGGLDGSVFFRGTPIAAPPLTDGTATVQTPYVLEGMLMTADPADPDADPIWVGFGEAGTATLFFERVLLDLWRVDRVLYETGQPAAHVPEPATLLLIGSGLLALARYGRGRAGSVRTGG